MSAQDQSLLSDGFASLDRFLAQRFQDVIGLFVDYLSTVNDFLAALYYSVCPGVVVEQFFPGCLRTHRIVNEIGGNVVVECTLPQDVSVIMGGITRYKILVGSLYGIDAVGRPLVGQLIFNHHDRRDAVVEEGPHLFCRYDSRLIDGFQASLDVSDVVRRRQYAFQMGMIILFQFGEGTLLHFFVQFKVRLERSQKTVLFPFYYRFVFVDRKIESCH